MTDSIAFEFDVLEGFALVAAAEVTTPPLWYDRTEGPTAGQVPIVLDVTPERPDAVVTLRDYTVTDDPSLSDSVMGVQVDIRASDRVLLRQIITGLFNAFHGRQAGMLGTVRLVSAARASGTWLGQDSNNRLQRTENYYLTLHRPSPNRT